MHKFTEKCYLVIYWNDRWVCVGHTGELQTAWTAARAAFSQFLNLSVVSYNDSQVRFWEVLLLLSALWAHWALELLPVALGHSKAIPTAQISLQTANQPPVHSWGQNSPNILFPATTVALKMQGEIIAAFWGLVQFPISFGLFFKPGWPYGVTAGCCVCPGSCRHSDNPAQHF